MSHIKAVNEFGNHVVIDYDQIKAVKKKNGIYQVLYSTPHMDERLLFLHNVNKPALLNGFQARAEATKPERKISTRPRAELRPRLNMRSLVHTHIPYIKAYEHHL